MAIVVVGKEWTVKKMTNADKIRAMTDEELADSRVGKIKGIAPCAVWIALDVPDKAFLCKSEALKCELVYLKESENNA